MIALSAECLLFEMANGEIVPLSSEMISVDVTGESADAFDQEFVKQAAASVFHYFKYELGRKSVTVGEFAEALEKVLRGFELSAQAGRKPTRPAQRAGIRFVFAGKRIRSRVRTPLFPETARRTPHPARAIPAVVALLRVARLRQTIDRRAPLDGPLSKPARPDCGISAGLSERRVQSGLLCGDCGIIFLRAVRRTIYTRAYEQNVVRENYRPRNPGEHRL